MLGIFQLVCSHPKHVCKLKKDDPGKKLLLHASTHPDTAFCDQFSWPKVPGEAGTAGSGLHWKATVPVSPQGKWMCSLKGNLAVNKFGAPHF